MINLGSIAIASLAVVILSGVAQAQRPRHRRQSIVAGAGEEESTKVTLALAVGRQQYNETGLGRCTYTPTASIYNTLAAMWNVEYAPSGSRSLTMTVWRPLAGDTTPQLNLYIGDGPTRYRIATVKGSELLGKGSVQIIKHREGGRFEITGSSAEGAAVRGSITCEKFAAPNPGAGN